MQKAATDVMQSIIFSAVLDGVAALKRASGGLPNQLLRDVQAIHANVTFADLPKELQDAIAETTRTAFTQLLKEGYAVGRASRCSSRGRSIACRSASGRIAADRRAARRKVIGVAAVRRGAVAMAAAASLAAAAAAAASRSGKPRG